MKKILLLSAFALSFLACNTAQAQVRVSINVGGPQVYQQPAYNDDYDYYYMPEIGAYYNVTRRLYVYNEGGRWISASYLPNRWRGYSYSRGIRINGRAPYMRHEEYRNRYSGWGGNQNDRGRGWDRRDQGQYEGRRGGYSQGHGGYNNGNGGRDRGYNGGRDGGRWNGGNSNGGNNPGGWNGGNNNGGGRNSGNNNGGGSRNGGNNNSSNQNGGNNGGGNQNGGNPGGGNNNGGNWHDRR